MRTLDTKMLTWTAWPSGFWLDRMNLESRPKLGMLLGVPMEQHPACLWAQLYANACSSIKDTRFSLKILLFSVFILSCIYLWNVEKQKLKGHCNPCLPSVGITFRSLHPLRGPLPLLAASDIGKREWNPNQPIKKGRPSVSPQQGHHEPRTRWGHSGDGLGATWATDVLVAEALAGWWPSVLTLLLEAESLYNHHAILPFLGENPPWKHQWWEGQRDSTHLRPTWQAATVR